MNDRERFLAAMRYEPVDRVPYRPQGVWQTTRQRWVEEGLPPNVGLAAHFGFDDWRILPLDVTMVPKMEPKVLETHEQWEIIVDEKGITKKQIKPASELSMPEWIDFPVKTRDDWLALRKRYDPAGPERYPADWDRRVAQWRNRHHVLGLDLYNGLYMTLREWFGPEQLLYAFYDQPELVGEMLEFYTDFLLQVFDRALRDVELDYVSLSEDFAFKSGPFISPKLFAELFVPCYRRLAERFAAAGVPVFAVDSDGNVEPLIRHLLDAGVNAVHPCEVAAGMDVLALRRTYGRDLRLWCGIDKRVLTAGPDAIDAELTRKLPPLLADGGYIPQIDHSVPPNVPLDRFEHYWRMLQRLAERAT